MMKTFGKAAIGTAAAAAVLLAAAPAASAATRTVCNAAFCNATTGSGTHVTKIVGTKRGDNLNVLGFFEVYSGNLKSTGPTTSANVNTLTVSWQVSKGTLVCLRFFAKTSAGKFVEVGTAQCTTSPF